MSKNMITNKSRVWDRKFWGIRFTSVSVVERPMILGALWDDRVGSTRRYPGEPLRPLLFETRADARAWATMERGKYRHRADCCGDWRFTPVRVTETVGED